MLLKPLTMATRCLGAFVCGVWSVVCGVLQQAAVIFQVILFLFVRLFYTMYVRFELSYK